MPRTRGALGKPNTKDLTDLLHVYELMADGETFIEAVDAVASLSSEPRRSRARKPRPRLGARASTVQRLRRLSRCYPSLEVVQAALCEPPQFVELQRLETLWDSAKSRRTRFRRKARARQGLLKIGTP